MKQTKFDDVKKLVNQFQRCEISIKREYEMKTENRFFIVVIALIATLILWGTFANSVILFVLGIVIAISLFLFLRYPLARIPLYIIDLLTRIRYSGDIAYDIKNRKREIRQILFKEYLSYIYSKTSKSNLVDLVILQAKKIIDGEEIITKSPD